MKFVPVSVTDEPTAPDVGEKPEIVGASTVTVKVPLLVPVPPGVVTLHIPDPAPAGTVAVIDVAEFTVNPGAFVEFSFT